MNTNLLIFLFAFSLYSSSLFAQPTHCDTLSALVSCDSVTAAISELDAYHTGTDSIRYSLALSAGYLSLRLGDHGLDAATWADILRCCQPPSVSLTDTSFDFCDDIRYIGFYLHYGFPHDSCLPVWVYDFVLPELLYQEQREHDSTFAMLCSDLAACSFTCPSYCPVTLATACDSMQSVYYVYRRVLADEQVDGLPTADTASLADAYYALYRQRLPAADVVSRIAGCDSGGCLSYLTASAVSSTPVCTGDSATLTASIAAHYLWSTGDTTRSIRVGSSDGYTVSTTSAAGCAAVSVGRRIVSAPAAPAVTGWQSACSNDAHVFRLDSVVAGPGGTHIEWCRYSSFDSTSVVAASGTTIYDTVQAGATDTLWLRSRDSVTGCYGSAVAAVIVNYNKPYPPKVLNAIQSAASDTPVTFIFTHIGAGPFGTGVEWSADSSFAVFQASDTAVSLSIIDTPGHVAAIYIRSRDSVSGCTSASVMAVAVIMSGKHGDPPIDTFQAVCTGDSTFITVPSSMIGVRYDLYRDSATILRSLMGTGDTIRLCTGAIDSSQTYSVIATDTATHTASIVDSGTYVLAYPPVTAPIFISGDTLISSSDSTWTYYNAIADNATALRYSILDSGAVIDSLTGSVSGVAHSFTLRAHAVGLPSCGSDQVTDIHVSVTDIGRPSAPGASRKYIDTPQTVSFTVDSLVAGANADQIEWSVHKDFSSSHIVSSPASATLTLRGPVDTVIYVRSRRSATGQVGYTINSYLYLDYKPELNGGLLNKNYWVYQSGFSDEFEYNQLDLSDFVNPSTRKWWLNYCWQYSSDPIINGRTSFKCDPADCNNHFFNPANEIVNYGNYTGTNRDGSGNEVFFVDPTTLHPNGYATLRASPLPSAPTFDICTADGGIVDPTVRTFKAGMLASVQKIPLAEPFLIEIRSKRPSNTVYLENGNPKSDVHVSAGMGGLQSNLTPFAFYDDDLTFMAQLEGYGTGGGNNGGCATFINNISGCDFTKDWHTFDILYTGASKDEVKFFINGKEMWSQPDVDLSTSDDLFQIATNFIVSTYNVPWSYADYLIDYIRDYKPNLDPSSPYYNPIGQYCLQNLQGTSRIAKTLENPNMEQAANTHIPFFSSLNYSFSSSIAPNKSLTALSTGEIFYQGLHNNIFKASPNVYPNPVNSYKEEIINGFQNVNFAGIPGISLFNWDVRGFLTPFGSNLAYYQTTANRLAYTSQNTTGGLWVSHPVMNVQRPINTLGYISVNTGGLVTYKGTDNNIYLWNGYNSSPVTTYATSGPVAGAIATATCGCFDFYVDGAYNLHQVYWSGIWHDLGIVSTGRLPDDISITNNGNVSNNLAIDETHSRVYFIGWDNAIYYYTYSYAARVPNSLVRLGQNATEKDNAGSFPGNSCSPYNAASNLVLSSDGNTIYYKGTDCKIWYYFNDNEYIILNNEIRGPNWNKTPMLYNLAGGMAIGATPGSDKFFYVGIDQKLYSPAWVDADEDRVLNCSNEWHAYRKAPLKADTTVTPVGLEVNVFPNPSQSSFQIRINNVVLDTGIDITIADVSGSIVYHAEGQIPDGSGSYLFLWQAGQVSKGVYFYKIRTTDGKRYLGKMVKI